MYTENVICIVYTYITVHVPVAFAMRWIALSIHPTWCLNGDIGELTHWTLLTRARAGDVLQALDITRGILHTDCAGVGVLAATTAVIVDVTRERERKRGMTEMQT